MNDHPQYPNSTIVEALCEFRITLSPDNPWKSTLPGALIAGLSASFPQVEPIAEFGMEVSIGPQGPTQRLIQSPPKFRFSNSDANRLIQVSSALCVFNVLRPYTTWGEMKSMISINWPVIRGIIKPKHIDRIGLRYINKIPVPQMHRVSDWLKPTDYIPIGLIKSLSPMNARIETRPSEDERISITVSDIAPEPNEPSPKILFDIDCICLRQLEGEMTEILSVIDSLHERIWLQFSSAMSDRLEQLLEEERASE